MEILSWANRKGFKNNLLLHGPFETIKKKLEKRLSDIQIIDTLKRTRIGVIGNPSDWLIASDVDSLEASKRWGVSIVDIDLKPVIENVVRFSESAALEILSSFPEPRFKESVRRRALVNAVKIYLGLKRTISEYRLTALTLRCFDLLTALSNTGCLALARLNDEGIPAGCEGDVPALFTMIVNRLITHTPAFMANPSRIRGRRLTMAHCTVPLSMVESFGYKTHFESDKGIGIAGNFKKDHVTLSKIGGPLLDRFHAAEGIIVDTPPSAKLCRTQVTVKMNEGVDYFLSNPLGNHHVITYGRHSERFKEIMALFGVSEVTGSNPL
jgi:L-fucose isomerase-like protein